MVVRRRLIYLPSKSSASRSLPHHKKAPFVEVTMDLTPVGPGQMVSVRVGQDELDQDDAATVVAAHLHLLAIRNLISSALMGFSSFCLLLLLS